MVLFDTKNGMFEYDIEIIRLIILDDVILLVEH